MCLYQQSFKREQALFMSNNNLPVDVATQTELEAAAFRTLVAHLQKRTDVQNIDLMNLSGFCRNCLSKYLVAAAEERGVAVNYDQARDHVYGMPYAEWKDQHQIEATDEQKAEYARKNPGH